MVRTRHVWRTHAPFPFVHHRRKKTHIKPKSRPTSHHITHTHSLSRPRDSTIDGRSDFRTFARSVTDDDDGSHSIDRSIDRSGAVVRGRHTPTHRRTGPSARTTRYTTLDLSRRTQKMFAQRTTAKVAPSAMRATASRGGRAVQARAGADRKMWCVARRRARGTVDDASVRVNFFRSRRVLDRSRYRSRPLVGRVALDGAHPYLRISRAISTLRVGGGSDALARAGRARGGRAR